MLISSRNPSRVAVSTTATARAAAAPVKPPKTAAVDHFESAKAIVSPRDLQGILIGLSKGVVAPIDSKGVIAPIDLKANVDGI